MRNRPPPLTGAVGRFPGAPRGMWDSLPATWGGSSIGRAPVLQTGGSGFESQSSPLRQPGGANAVFRVSGLASRPRTTRRVPVRPTHREDPTRRYREMVQLVGRVVWDHEISGFESRSPYSGMAQSWKRVGLINRRSRVRLPVPLCTTPGS